MIPAGDLLDALSGRPCSALSRVAVGALAPLSLLYAVGLKLYLLPYSLGWRRQYRLPVPVVSVGNLASGGTGKTGLVLTLVRALRSAGLDVCILSRGYRGSLEGSAGVVSDRTGTLMDAARAGDEALMLAEALPGTPVLVGRDRRLTGRLAVERFAPDVIVLDDGMQYYQLHRDREITLLDAERPFGNGLTLPAGILREPPGHLRRSNWIVLSGDEAQGLSNADLPGPIRRLGGHARVLFGGYRGTGLSELGGLTHMSVASLAGRRVATICGLGNPERFERQVIRSGAQVVRTVRYPDHHVPPPAVLAATLEACARDGAEMAIVSRKDAVKLVAEAMPTELHAGNHGGWAIPIWVYEAEYVVSDTAELIEDLMALVRQPRRNPSETGTSCSV